MRPVRKKRVGVIVLGMMVLQFVSSCKTNNSSAWRYGRHDLAGACAPAFGSRYRLPNKPAVRFVLCDVESVLTGDVDGDGVIDIVTTTGDEVRIYAGNGSLKHTFKVPRPAFLAMLEDVDGDGVLDIGLGSFGGPVSAYLYKGNGTLLKTFVGQHAGGEDVAIRPLTIRNGKVLVGYNAGYACTPRGVAAFDYSTGDEVWYYQVGPAPGYSALFSVGDMDRDGLLDITFPSLTVHNGASGNGTTDGDMYLVVVDEAGTQKLSQIYTPPTDGGAAHVLADMDVDGYLEVIGFKGHDSTYYPGQSRIHIFNFNGAVRKTFCGPYNNNWIGSAWSGSYAVGDVDADGTPEIVATAVPSLVTYVLDKDLNVKAQANLGGEVRLIADTDGDGLKEIVLLSNDGLLKIADRNLKVLSTVQVGTQGGEVLVSDIDNDGRLDLLAKTDKLYVVSYLP